MLYQHASKLDRAKPMAAARIVRMEKYAWPGGYPLALIMDDGAALCPDCVASEFPQISYAVRTKQKRGGWYPAGLANLGDQDEPEYCAHCDREIGAHAAETNEPEHKATCPVAWGNGLPCSCR